MAYAKTKIDSVSDKTTSLVIVNSLEMVVRAGAIMDEETGEMKVKEDTRRDCQFWKVV